MITPDALAVDASSLPDDPERPDVWVLTVTDPAVDALADAGPVTDAERSRAELLHGEPARRAFLVRRAVTRMILGAYLGREAHTVEIVTLPGGKPTFLPRAGDARRLGYSSSHSGDLFCLAVGLASSVGVDVERERDVPRAEAIASRWFSPEEVRMLSSTPFLELWTGKEALAKRHSAGLRLLRRGPNQLDVRGEAEAGRLARFRPAEGFVGALASTSRVASIRLLGEPGGSPGREP